ncbi:ribosome maturation factor RimP [Pseudobutyrivibrio sp. MD2005]|uniref:ribosome maturation factor RimP n=1 Tax=Pseudobutyrivibrio sp. MD2005 TaxID=1410616 RepID=UPI000484E4C5|nr:ribosome maturation factor RimP [Pseudobutyrivibrio sp. MD2005]
MSKHTDYEKRTEELITPILDEMGFELYDVEYVKEGADYYLRAYIDKEGGITIDDCVDVSRRMNDLLDAEPQIGGDDGYIFEVSSPGLGRVLKKDKHLEKAIGQDVDIKTYKPVNGAKEFTGTLKAFDKDTITVEFEDGIEQFNRSEVAQIRLSIDF